MPRSATLSGALGEVWARDVVDEAWEMAAEENRDRLRADLRKRLNLPPETPDSEIARRAPLEIGDGGFFTADRLILPLIAEAAGDSDLAVQLAEGLAQFCRLPETPMRDQQLQARQERYKERMARDFERLCDPSERQRRILAKGIDGHEEIASARLAPLLEKMLLERNRDAAEALIAEHLGRIDPDLAARAAVPGRIEHLETLVRALSHRDEDHRYSSRELWKRACDACERHVKFLASPRARGDDAYQMRYLSGFSQLRTYRNSAVYEGSAAGSVDDLVRDALTSRSRMISNFSRGVPSDGESIYIPTTISATGPLLADMKARGLEPQALVLKCRELVHTDGLDRHAVFLGVRVEGQLEGRPTAIIFTSDLGIDTRSTTEAGTLASARKAAPEARSLLESTQHVSAVEWKGGLREDFVVGEGAVLRPLPSQWAASGSCAHRSLAWRRNFDGDSTVLDCMECGTQGFASVPQHRVPQGHPQAGIADERDYLSRERMYAVLRGDDPDDVPGSVAELIERDGPVRMAPELWLGKQTPLERRARPLGAGIDVAGVGRQRRR